MDGKYSVDLFREGGESAGIEATLARHNDPLLLAPDMQLGVPRIDIIPTEPAQFGSAQASKHCRQHESDPAVDISDRSFASSAAASVMRSRRVAAHPPPGASC